MKLVINKCFGGYGLSRKAVLRLRELGCEGANNDVLCDEVWPDTGETNNSAALDYGLGDEISRDDPLLVQVVEELGEEANGPHASLKIIEIPDGTDWVINNYDGMESVHERHCSWG
jgi:hypothetical protein